jgi:transposase
VAARGGAAGSRGVRGRADRDGLARRARAEGIEVAVCVPTRTDRGPADRVKTDKRDAIRLARRLAAGELTLVTVPSVEHEQLRDVVRCREDIRMDLMRARHRLSKFLLRHEIYYEGSARGWSRQHRGWLASLRLSNRASQLTIGDYLHAHYVLIARRDGIESELEPSVGKDHRDPWLLQCSHVISVHVGRLRRIEFVLRPASLRDVALSVPLSSSLARVGWWQSCASRRIGVR